jgi:hypothetical protein
MSPLAPESSAGKCAAKLFHDTAACDSLFAGHRQRRHRGADWPHNSPVVGSIPTRPTRRGPHVACDLRKRLVMARVMSAWMCGCAAVRGSGWPYAAGCGKCAAKWVACVTTARSVSRRCWLNRDTRRRFGVVPWRWFMIFVRSPFRSSGRRMAWSCRCSRGRGRRFPSSPRMSRDRRPEGESGDADPRSWAR